MAENTNHPHRYVIRHETSDVNIPAIGKLGAGLVIVTVLSIAVVIGVFQFFNTRDNRVAQTVDPARIFPTPQLLTDEPKNLQQYRAGEEKLVNGYGWVDQKNGVVRIPVSQAMELMVKRGLPTRQQSAGGPAGVSVPTESGLGVAPQVVPEEPKK